MRVYLKVGRPPQTPGGGDDVLAQRGVFIRLAAVDLAHQLAPALCHIDLLSFILPHPWPSGKGQRDGREAETNRRRDPMLRERDACHFYRPRLALLPVAVDRA